MPAPKGIKAATPIYLSPSAIGGTIGADRSGHGQLRLENSVSGWDDWATIRHVAFDRGGLGAPALRRWISWLNWQH
ncbi:hypothetical protein OAM69_00180 [bacterium]|nr:hypothetical protein [bacterium]